MDLQHPERKMSKSEESPQGTILILDPPEVIEKKLKRAVTDSDGEVFFDPIILTSRSSTLYFWKRTSSFEDEGNMTFAITCNDTTSA